MPLLLAGCAKQTTQTEYTASVICSFDKTSYESELNLRGQTFCVRDFILMPGEQMVFGPMNHAGRKESQALCAVGTAIYACFQQMDPDSVVDYTPHEAIACAWLGDGVYDSEGNSIPTISLHDEQTITVCNTREVPLRLWVEWAYCQQGLRFTATLTADETLPTYLYDEFTEEWYGTHFTLDDEGLSDDSLIVFNRRSIDPDTGKQAFCSEHLICFEYGNGERDYWLHEEQTSANSPVVADLDEDGLDEVVLFVDLWGAVGDTHVIKCANGAITEVLTVFSGTKPAAYFESSHTVIEGLPTTYSPDVITNGRNTSLLFRFITADVTNYWIVDWNGSEYEIRDHAHSHEEP